MHVEATRALRTAPADDPPSARLLGRTAAVAAAGSAVAHLLLLDSSSLGSLAMIAMALSCLPCAWHLWRSPTSAVWALTATLDGAMLALHVPMLAGSTHQHGATPELLPWLALGLVVTQLALAGAAAIRRLRDRVQAAALACETGLAGAGDPDRAGASTGSGYPFWMRR